MDLLIAARVASRHLASKAIARDLDGFLTLVEKDYKAGTAWVKRFCYDLERVVKKAHGDLLRSGGWDKGELDQILKGTLSAISEFQKKPSVETAYALRRAADEVHNEVWDPEMFADGQTKEDYGRKAIDDLFDPIFEACNKANEFMRRFETKYEFGSINVTLDTVLPEGLDSTDIAIGYLKAFKSGGFDDGMKALLSGLEKAKKEADKTPGAKAKGVSVGVALSALLQEATKARDEWTVRFTNSLMDMNRHRRTFSPKQKEVLEDKLQKYDIPTPNYAVAF